LTVASTPSIRLSFFSTRAAQEAQVMPPMASSTRSPGGAAAVDSCVPMPGVAVLMMLRLPSGRLLDRFLAVGQARLTSA
jgi:hypothetical protein